MISCKKLLALVLSLAIPASPVAAQVKEIVPLPVETGPAGPVGPAGGLEQQPLPCRNGARPYSQRVTTSPVAGYLLGTRFTGS